MDIEQYFGGPPIALGLWQPKSCRRAMNRLSSALSEEKAEEAKLLQARLEGFRMALKIFGGDMSEGGIGVADDRDARATKAAEEPARKRRRRRNIPELITRKLSFSGQPMTACQIAEAIEYSVERAETVLSRMEKKGQIIRDKEGRWAVGLATLGRMNGHAVKASNGKLPRPHSWEVTIQVKDAPAPPSVISAY